MTNEADIKDLRHVLKPPIPKMYEKKRFLISDMKCLTCYRAIQNGQNILEAQWCPRRQNLNLFIHRVRRGPRPSPNRPLARRRPHSRPGS